ncbi:hypothetical protein I4F81_009306 [Pyropia yezoensis]|uniref:Uncharacterized protein n=2 Tax=Pyropia yezoensis TaxID=2788 RepID=A0ACC3C924_PYRYE|nr:hypothetical protein I4F81_009306 [Neopyropia yezoensis]
MDGRHPSRVRGLLWASVVVVPAVALSGRWHAAVAQGGPPPAPPSSMCSPAHSGPTEDISAPERFEDALRTAVSPVNFGLRIAGTAVHAHDGDPMSAVMQDLLRHLNVEQHPCLQRPFETRCGLSVNHPATLGVSLYEFNDTETRLTGHAVQTEVAGICLDDACIKITPVAIHRPSFESMPSSSSRHGGVAACSYQLIPGGSLASIVGAMATVEEVRNLSALAAERGTVVTEYGVVVRHADRTWRADVFRDAILPIPAENTPLFCNLTELKVAGLDSYAEGLSAKGDPTSAPRRLPTLKTDAPGCTFSNGSPYSGGPDGGAVAPPPGSRTFPAAPSFLHVADADVNGTVSLHCSRYGDLLRVAASSAASTQDAVATGHQGANFLSRVPPLAAPIEITLLVVTAVQGLFTAFVLLFDRPDERLRRFEATYRQWRDRAPLPLNDNVIVPRRERNVPRAVLLLLVIIIAIVEFLPLVVVVIQEAEAQKWKGVFAHVDLVVMMPGSIGGSSTSLPQPLSDFPPVPSSVLAAPAAGLPCSKGVSFVLLPVFGVARHMHTRLVPLAVTLAVVLLLALLLITLRVALWWYASLVAEEKAARRIGDAGLGLAESKLVLL